MDRIEYVRQSPRFFSFVFSDRWRGGVFLSGLHARTAMFELVSDLSFLAVEVARRNGVDNLRELRRIGEVIGAAVDRRAS